MKTKRVELYCDLYPGWQDAKPPYVWTSIDPPTDKPPSFKRVKIWVDLPCFGGSADVDEVVEGKAEVIE